MNDWKFWNDWNSSQSRRRYSFHLSIIFDREYNVTEMLSQLDPYEVDAERGFLPRPDPLDCLPKEFAAWEEIGTELPKLMLTGRIRSFIS